MITLCAIFELAILRLSGGIHDQIDGGFHRYAVEPTWVVPHFEKMLYDNAQLAALYGEAGQVLGEVRFDEIARDTLDFIILRMSGEEGGFFSSYDADSGGREGSFYVWTRAEVQRTISAFAERMKQSGLQMALWFDVAEKLAGPYYEVVVAGDEDDPRTAKLVGAFNALRPSHAVLIRVPASGPGEELMQLLPCTAGKSALGGQPTAFLCRLGACGPPIFGAQELRSQLLDGWKH